MGAARLPDLRARDVPDALARCRLRGVVEPEYCSASVVILFAWFW